ncbi:MAG TPA: [protein-PII] uridylyltransferase [Candidatus Cybelea sp.]|nr:[protein-PII] uridylyltransferase [Candidatus Cybelea sp.]
MAAPLSHELRALYSGESARVRDAFQANGRGPEALAARTALVESIALRLWRELVSPDSGGPHDFALVALGGFGRRWLFPYSDVDLLFLHAAGDTEREFKDAVRRFSQELWDLRVKLSPAARTLSECARFDPNNAEFSISLLDGRYLAGDRRLFSHLHERVIPKLVERESRSLLERLAELARERYAKFGDTVFHLETNVKDGPGGLRDCNLVSWIELISHLGKHACWPDEASLLPASVRKQYDPALSFLMSLRCFLHFRHSRDDNTLAWEAQNEAAALHVGMAGPTALSASDWMRVYFGHARTIHRMCVRLLDEIPAAGRSLYRQFQHMRSRVSNPEFLVVDGRIAWQGSEGVREPEVILRAFRFLARHDLRLSSAFESQIEQALPLVCADPPRGIELWHHLQEILIAPHAGAALREMHLLGFLTVVLPEMGQIDALVVRDYSHRFTVDEHTFVAIENLHELRQSRSKWDQRYAELLEEIEQPDLLYLALLLHDVGKGAKSDNHVQASVAIAETCLDRLELDEPDRETVLFLIAHHLELSACLRRDIFDPDTVRQLAERVETPERLKMLCLLTYADIKAVSPEALTPWKAEDIWQLYIGTANYFIRTVDDRFHASMDDEVMAHLLTLAPAAGHKLESFLEGLPRRYLRTHAASEIIGHIGMADRLADDRVQIALSRGRHLYELTLVTRDRPFLFATLAGVLAAWGMNIVKAAAFSNQARIVVDTFYFTDRFRTLELNLPEWERFKSSIHDVLTGKADLEKMLHDRMRSGRTAAPKVEVEPRVEIDDACSTQSTLIEVIGQDRPGFLHGISSIFSRENCNIEIAIIETEGQTAIDVFYLTAGGAKLTTAHQERVRDALMAELTRPQTSR